jgi:hypothetical protein
MIVNVKTIKFNYDSEGLSHITCYLTNKKLFDIELEDFYYCLLLKDEKLHIYSKKFNDWESFTNDLLTLSFDFKQACENYINNQFSEEELQEFTYSEF